VVHVAIAPGRLGERLALEAMRLNGLKLTAVGCDAGGKTSASSPGAMSELNDDRRDSRIRSGDGHKMDGANG
jgi:hypothetical protein